MVKKNINLKFKENLIPIFYSIQIVLQYATKTVNNTVHGQDSVDSSREQEMRYNNKNFRKELRKESQHSININNNIDQGSETQLEEGETKVDEMELNWFVFFFFRGRGDTIRGSETQFVEGGGGDQSL